MDYLKAIERFSEGVRSMVEAGYSNDEIRNHLRLALKAQGRCA